MKSAYQISKVVVVGSQEEMLGSVKASGGADWSVLIMDGVTTKVVPLFILSWNIVGLAGWMSANMHEVLHTFHF